MYPSVTAVLCILQKCTEKRFLRNVSQCMYLVTDNTSWLNLPIPASSTQAYLRALQRRSI